MEYRYNKEWQWYFPVGTAPVVQLCQLYCIVYLFTIKRIYESTVQIIKLYKLKKYKL